MTFARKGFLPGLFVMLLGFAFSTDGGEDVKIISTKIEKYRKAYPQEKIHLHTDKPYYSVGDTVYCKAYVVNAEKHTPSVISNILYVDLVNDSNVVKQTLLLPVTDGIAWGTMELGDSLREGAYRIRAYTNWMRNFDGAYFFDESILIGNGFNSDIVTTASFASGSRISNAISVQYSSLRNISLANKEVSYAVLLNKKEKAKGKIVTNADGVIQINLPDLHLPEKQTALLVTHIRLDDKKQVTKEIPISLPSQKYHTQFFPESGQMVAGLPARIGFKAVDENGWGTDVQGTITDDSSSVSLSFQSGFAGIGSVSFTPQPNHTYHAVVKYKNNTEETVPLPPALAYGYVLAINNSDDKSIAIAIDSKQPVPADKVILVAQSNNRVLYAAPLMLSDGKAFISMPKTKFPTGIVQFTLFDDSLRPVAERLAFANHHDELRIDLEPDKAVYDKREKVKMLLQVKDEKGNPVEGSFSMAVADARTVSQNKEQELTILSDLLLSSDLKGYIQSPAHYFTDENKATAKELDDLLLTQGWRRFAWQDLLEDKYPATQFAIEKSLSVRGKVVSSKGEPVAKSRVALLEKEGTGFLLDTLSDENGNFHFDELSFDDDQPFLVKASGSETVKNVTVRLTPFVSPPVSGKENVPRMPFVNTSLLLPYLTSSHQRYEGMRKSGLLQEATTLKEVVVTTTRITKVREAVAPSANLNGPGNADQILTYEDLQNCHDLSICLQGKITGVTFKMVVEDPAARVKTWHLLPFSTSGMGAPMLVNLDGVDINVGRGGLDMRNIPVHNIQSIEVLRSGGYLSAYGLRGSSGVLVITTKRGGINYDEKLLQNNKAITDAVFTTAKGYSISRRFYAPEYNSEVLRRTAMPDLRSTLYWQPNIVTDEEGKATIEWYNADNTGDCHIVIEGISTEGALGHASLTYTVN